MLAGEPDKTYDGDATRLSTTARRARSKDDDWNRNGVEYHQHMCMGMHFTYVYRARTYRMQRLLLTVSFEDVQDVTRTVTASPLESVNDVLAAPKLSDASTVQREKLQSYPSGESCPYA